MNLKPKLVLQYIVMKMKLKNARISKMKASRTTVKTKR